MLWIDHDVLVFIDDVDDVQLDAELLGDPERVVAFRPAAIMLANRMGMSFDTEAGKEIDAFDLDTLLLDQLGSQQRIKAAGDQRNCFSGHAVGLRCKTPSIAITGLVDKSTRPLYSVYCFITSIRWWQEHRLSHRCWSASCWCSRYR